MSSNKKVRIFISGAVTGTTDYYQRFLDAEMKLKEKGFIVFNPIRVHQEMPDDCTYQEYMNISIELLKMCDAVFMMKDYERSNGAKAEFAYMFSVGKPIYLETFGYPEPGDKASNNLWRVK